MEHLYYTNDKRTYVFEVLDYDEEDDVYTIHYPRTQQKDLIISAYLEKMTPVSRREAEEILNDRPQMYHYRIYKKESASLTDSGICYAYTGPDAKKNIAQSYRDPFFQERFHCFVSHLPPAFVHDEDPPVGGSGQ